MQAFLPRSPSVLRGETPMNRMLRSTRVTCVAGLLSATLVSAGHTTSVVGYEHSTVQSSYIDLAGSTNGLPDNCSDQRCGDWLVTIRDFANDPVVGAHVDVDFSACSDIRLACDQLTAVTGQTLTASGQVE